MVTECFGDRISKSLLKAGVGVIGLGLAGFALSAPALAQDSADAAQNRTGENGAQPAANQTDAFGNVIIVTARKREELLQDIPVAVAALSGDSLDDVGIQRLDETTALIPNLRVSHAGTGPGVASLYIRGIGYNGTEKLEAPSVGVFIDDFYWGMGHGQLLDTFDIERIEVLRGPQSVLFGKNTSGGAIVVRRTKPQGYAGGKVKVGIGNYDQRVLQGVFHTPAVLDETLSFKFGATYRERDGYATNLYDGTSEGDYQYLGLHGMARWEPTDNLEGLFVFDYNRERGEATPLQNDNVLGVDLFFGGQQLNPGVRPHEVWPDLVSDQRLDAYRASLRLDWETSIGTITSITGYLDEADYTLQDFDSGCGADTQGLGCGFTPNPLLVSAANPTGTLHTIRDQEFKEFTQEIRIATPLTDTLFIQAGGFFYDDAIESRQTTNFAAFERTTQDTRSYALFGQFEWDILPDLTATAGAQWIHEEKSYTKTVFFLPDVPVVGGTVLLPLLEEEKSWEDTVFQASLSWTPSPDHMLYVSLSDGFRSGGFSARGTAAEAVDATLPNYTGGTGENFLAFDPETTRQIEIGSKNTFFDGALTLNLTAFRTELKGLQNGSVALTPNFGVNTNTYVNNFQLAEFKGFEIESILKIPGVKGLTLLANMGYLDASLEEALVLATRLGVGAGGLPGSPQQGLIDLSATPLPQAPEYTYALTANYEQDITDDLQINSTVQFSYVDDVVLRSLGTSPDVQKGYGLLDGSIGLSWQKFSLQLIGKNLLDKEYRVNSLPNVLFQGWGNPRTVLLELTAQF